MKKRPIPMDDDKRYERTFARMVATPELRLVDDAVTSSEGRRRDVRRIASTVFCSADIDPSIVSFAKQRTAAHWGMTEEEVDLRVTRRLLHKAASLMTDLQWLSAEAPHAGRPQDFPAMTAA